jgi:hypothetical protein
LPVAAKTAFPTAAAIGGTPGSPIPPGALVLEVSGLITTPQSTAQ